MSLALTKCIIDRKLTGKVDMADLKETSGEYAARGMTKKGTWLGAVEEKIASLKDEHANVIAQVRAAYDKSTGRPSGLNVKPPIEQTQPRDDLPALLKQKVEQIVRPPVAEAKPESAPNPAGRSADLKRVPAEAQG